MVYMFSNKKFNTNEVIKNENDNSLVSKGVSSDDIWGLDCDEEDEYLLVDGNKDYIFTEDDDKIVDSLKADNFYYSALYESEVQLGPTVDFNGNVQVDSCSGFDTYERFYSFLYKLKKVGDVFVVDRKMSDFYYVSLFFMCVRLEKVDISSKSYTDVYTMVKEVLGGRTFDSFESFVLLEEILKLVELNKGYLDNQLHISHYIEMLRSVEKSLLSNIVKNKYVDDILDKFEDVLINALSNINSDAFTEEDCLLNVFEKIV